MNQALRLTLCVLLGCVAFSTALMHRSHTEVNAFAQLREQLVAHMSTEEGLAALDYMRDRAATHLANKVMFEASEHKDIGNKAWDMYRMDVNKELAKGFPLSKPFLLPNNMELTFGDMVALGGDFYGNVDQPLCFVADDKLRVVAANALFDKFLSKDPDHIKEFSQIKMIFARELKLIQDGMKAGKRQHEAMGGDGGKLITQDFTRVTDNRPTVAQNKLEGGHLLPPNYYNDVVVRGGRFMKLAKANNDHFDSDDCTMKAYLAMQEAAIMKARQASALHASATSSAALLKLAFVQAAWASHFLTDRFAGGHLRVPREKLNRGCLTAVGAGSGLARCFHDEDNIYGVNVENDLGDKWTAYGDTMYFEKVNDDNRKNAIAAVMKSIEEVDCAFRGVRPQPPVSVLHAPPQKPADVTFAPGAPWSLAKGINFGLALKYTPTKWDPANNHAPMLDFRKVNPLQLGIVYQGLPQGELFIRSPMYGEKAISEAKFSSFYRPLLKENCVVLFTGCLLAEDNQKTKPPKEGTIAQQAADHALWVLKRLDPLGLTDESVRNIKPEDLPLVGPDDGTKTASVREKLGTVVAQIRQGILDAMNLKIG